MSFALRLRDTRGPESFFRFATVVPVEAKDASVYPSLGAAMVARDWRFFPESWEIVQFTWGHRWYVDGEPTGSLVRGAWPTKAAARAAIPDAHREGYYGPDDTGGFRVVRLTRRVA